MPIINGKFAINKNKTINKAIFFFDSLFMYSSVPFAKFPINIIEAIGRKYALSIVKKNAKPKTK